MPLEADREKMDAPRYDLVPIEVLDALAIVLNYGAKKYAPRNWEKGLPQTQICASLTRHMFAYMAGENIDPDSGVHHAHHMAANVAFLCHHVKHGIGDDRRHDKGPSEVRSEVRSEV